MAIFQYNGVTDWPGYRSALTAQAHLLSVSSTEAQLEYGGFTLRLLGSGFGLAGTGTITGAEVYQSNESANTVFGTVYARSTAGLSISLSSVLATVAGNIIGLDPLKVLLAGNDVLNGSAASDQIFGYAGADVINGGAGDDFLVGDNPGSTVGFADELNGGDGRDSLNGGAGADIMRGGRDDDLYTVDDAGDQVIELAGGGNFDRVLISRLTGTDRLTSYTLPSQVENLTIQPNVTSTTNGGTAATFTGTGNAADNKLEVGASGINSAYTSHDRVVFYGLAGNDRLVGGPSDDYLDGGTGDDTMIGGLGSDTFVVDSAGDRVYDTLVGAPVSDVDTVLYTLAVPAGRAISLGGTAPGLVNQAVFAGVGVEGLQLGLATSTAALNAVGSTGQDKLVGNAAANTLVGLAGNDWLDGGAGADRLEGGAGDDTYVIDTVADQIIELPGAAGGNDTVRTALSGYSLAGTTLENLTLLGTGAQNAVGNALDNILTAGPGDNTVDGGAGNDTASWAEASAAVTVRLTTSGAQATGGSGSDTLISIENLTGSAFNDTLVGDAQANVLTGGQGSDRLTGGAGADVFVLNNALGSDTITDFSSGVDKLRISQSGLKIGDGDNLIEGVVTLASPGGFAPTAELVVVSANLSFITGSNIVDKLGNASAPFAVGDHLLVAVHSGPASALYLFTAANDDALITGNELIPLAQLAGMATLGAGDLLFGG